MKLPSLPAIDIRACVFAATPLNPTDNHTLFDDITDRVMATVALCADVLGLSLLQTHIDWNSITPQGVQVALETPTSMGVPLFVPWACLENEASMLGYAGIVAQPAVQAA